MNKIKLQNINEEIAILELVNRHFWKSKIGPLCAIIIPLFLMTMYKIISDNLVSMFVGGLPSYFAFSILPLAFISLPQMIVEFKESIILRKISNSRITIIKFLFIIFVYNFLAIICSTILIIVLYAIFLNKDAKEGFSSFNWGELIYALLNIYICALSLGIMLGILINRVSLVQFVGFALIIISVVFSGQFIPLQVLARSNAIRYISLLSPMSYSLNMLNVIIVPTNKEFILLNENNLATFDDPKLTEILWQNFEKVKNYQFNGLFDVKNSFIVYDWSVIPGKENEIPKISKITPILIYENWQNILNLIMPYVFSIIFIGISIKKFKWTSR